MVQHHARAGMITARGGGEDDEGPQAGDVAVLHVREVDVNLAGIPGEAGERPNQALVAVLVDLTRDEQPGLVCETGDPQLPVVRDYVAWAAGTVFHDSHLRSVRPHRIRVRSCGQSAHFPRQHPEHPLRWLVEAASQAGCEHPCWPAE